MKTSIGSAVPIAFCAAVLSLSLAAAPGCKKGATQKGVTLFGPEESSTVCSRETIVERVVDVPWTADEARARHAPPKTTATVETFTTEEDPSTGGDHCAGAGIICAAALVLPFGGPTIHQIAVIQEPDRQIQAVYTEGGALENARVTVGQVVRIVESRSSNRLNRRFILETGRHTLGADGKEGELIRTSRLEQVPHLRDIYLAALEEDQRTDPEEGGLLQKTVASQVEFTCADMNRVLGSDKTILGREYLESPRLNDEVKGYLRENLGL